jgi:phage virion morphogenesis protein
MDFAIEADDARILAALRRVGGVFSSPAPLLRDIAALGEASTRLRFRTQTAPDGTPWKPSLRAQITGGRTLTDRGHLADSLSSRADANTAQWGVNRIYAAIHQFGGTIRAKAGGALRFPLAGGGYAVVKAVTMPARPYLGISPDDADDIVALIERRVAVANQAASDAG